MSASAHRTRVKNAQVECKAFDVFNTQAGVVCEYLVVGSPRCALARLGKGKKGGGDRMKGEGMRGGK